MTTFFVGFVVGYVIASVAACAIWRRAIQRHNVRAATRREGEGEKSDD